MKVRIMSDLAAAGKSPEVLFWVGCAGSYDARAQKVTKAFVEILNDLEVDYAILGQEEACTGDPARRAGNEFVFQMLALQNIETLKMYNVKRIITTCPHCFNVLKNEYPDLGGEYEVMHHSEFLYDLMKNGKLKVEGEKQTVTYHDSCYLGRSNNIYSAPRNVLDKLNIEIKEMGNHHENAMCCGAGGAQMFKEDEPGNDRINEVRIVDAIDTGAKTVVANCPFCITMLEDGLKAKDKQDEIEVLDLAEMIIKAKK